MVGEAGDLASKKRLACADCRVRSLGTGNGRSGKRDRCREGNSDITDRDGIADERDRLADHRDLLANVREIEGRTLTDGLVAVAPGSAATAVDQLARLDDQLAPPANAPEERAARMKRSGDPIVDGSPDSWSAEKREFVADDRAEQADDRQERADQREVAADRRDEVLGELARHVSAAEAAAAVRRHPLARRQRQQDARASSAVARDEAGAAREVATAERATSGGPHRLAAQFVKMGELLLTADTVESGMSDIVEAAVRFVDGCDAASFSMLVDDVVTTIAATSVVAAEVDQAQYATAEGPSLQAIRTLQLVISEDLSRDERWPEFTAAAGDAVRSAMSTPAVRARPAAASIATLNAYAVQKAAFDEADADAAMLLTAHLGVLLQLAAAVDESNQRALQLSDAVQTRDVIGQAKGILMERGKITAPQAFDVLQRASQRLNRKPRDVAEEVTLSGRVPARPAPPPRR